MDDKDLTQHQKNVLERRSPLNSYPGLRSLIRYTVNPPD
jgi:hypothetical protein